MGRKCIDRVEAQQWTAQANRNEALKASSAEIETLQRLEDCDNPAIYWRDHSDPLGQRSGREKWDRLREDFGALSTTMTMVCSALDLRHWSDDGDKLVPAIEALKAKAALPLGDALHEFPQLDQLPFESYLKHAGAIDTLQELGYTYSEVNECWEAPPAEAEPPAPEKEKPGFTFYLFVLLASAAGAYLTIKYAVP